jgi:Na+/proline symporter
VLPPVKADTFARATPDRAVTAFKVVLFLFELLAVALALMSLRITRRGIVGGIVTCGIIVLVLSLLLLDAANSFRAHGPDLRVADEFLYGCFVVAVLVSILLFVVAFVLRKGRKELQV